MSTGTEQEYDVIVVGFGAAGLTAALSARRALGETGRVLILERATRAERGGNTKWTGAYLRLADEYTPADGLLEDAAAFSEGHADIEYWQTLLSLLPETMEWLQEMGLRFQPKATNFLSKARPRLLPVGGGEAIVRILGDTAERRGIQTRYRATATRLAQDADGAVGGVVIRGYDGRETSLRARAVILASGGFEGNQRMKAQYFGRDAFKLRPIAPGGAFNKGEGICMAVAAGAKAAGQWDAFHAEPFDPRSSQPAPTNMTFPYGILVNQLGARFVDEGAQTVDENYENVARRIREQPSGLAYIIGDRKLRSITGIDRAIRTPLPPLEAQTLAELAGLIGVPAGSLTETVDAYNKSVVPGEFDPARADGVATVGLYPPKSNWARSIDEPPFLAYPVACSVVFTFGGIGTDLKGRVVTEDDVVIPGLFAAGECTGAYYGKYLGATSVLRSLVYGRVAGLTAGSSARARA